MDLDAIFRLNSPSVVARVIDGEAILIAFETGAYYSARGSGAVIIEAIQQETSARRIIDAFATRGGGSRGDIERAVMEFLTRLREEGLAQVHARPEHPVNGETTIHQEEVFEPPVLEKYSDLEDLLMLDPIHDVDAAGWPAAKARVDPR